MYDDFVGEMKFDILVEEDVSGCKQLYWQCDCYEFGCMIGDVDDDWGEYVD